MSSVSLVVSKTEKVIVNPRLDLEFQDLLEMATNMLVDPKMGQTTIAELTVLQGLSITKQVEPMLVMVQEDQVLADTPKLLLEVQRVHTETKLKLEILQAKI